jgi:hypothetical protein
MNPLEKLNLSSLYRREPKMKIMIMGDRYYMPVENGYREISKAFAMELYEKGEVTNEEVSSYEHD